MREERGNRESGIGNRELGAGKDDVFPENREAIYPGPREAAAPSPHGVPALRAFALRPGRHILAGPDSRFPIPDSRFSRTRIVAAARTWLGTPYVHQASAKGSGADCLGLVRGLYTELCGREPETPPPYTPDWNERRPCEEPLLNAARRHLVEASPSPCGRGVRGEGPVDAVGVRNSQQRDPLPRPLPHRGRGEEFAFLPGQILIFRIVTTGPAKHCGIVSAEGQFIHAYAGRCVIESWLSRWWTERIAGVFDFPGVEG